MKSQSHTQSSNALKIPKVPKPTTGLGPGVNMHQRTYIPELDATVQDIKQLRADFTKVIELKGMIGVDSKVGAMLELLQEAQQHLKSQDSVGQLLN